MENLKRDSMVFYDSFFEAIKDLPAEEFKKCACSILGYGLYGEMPEAKGVEKTIFVLAKPQIDKNNQRWINSKKKGKPKKEAFAEKGEMCNGKTEATQAEKVYMPEPSYDADYVDESCENDDGVVEENNGCTQDLSHETQELKDSYGEYNNVYLTDAERKTLVASLGSKLFCESCDFLSRYIRRKPQFKSACHFEDLRDWVQKAIKERGGGKEEKKSSVWDEISFEDIYEKP